VLIAVAAWLLALAGGGALFVSFTAQYAYIRAVRRQGAASVIEALLLDLGMIVFTVLALGLSRAGQPAPDRTGSGPALRRRVGLHERVGRRSG
jgi:small-conductance mechanosensitive channel